MKHMCQWYAVRYVLKHGAGFFELGLPVAIRRFAAYYVSNVVLYLLRARPACSYSMFCGLLCICSRQCRFHLLKACYLACSDRHSLSLSLYVRQDRCVSLSSALQARSIIYGEFSLSLVVVPRPPNSLISASLVEPS